MSDIDKGVITKTMVDRQTDRQTDRQAILQQISRGLNTIRKGRWISISQG